MSHFKAKMHRIRLLVFVRLFVRWSLTLASHEQKVSCLFSSAILISVHAFDIDCCSV